MSATSQRAPSRHAAYTVLDRTPYWLLAAMLLGVLFVWRIQTDETYKTIFETVSKGLWVTIWVTVISFTGAVIVGLLVALARGSHNRVVYEAATFYVEIVRGVPMLVLLLYIAFVVAPALVGAVNWIGQQLAGVWHRARGPGRPIGGVSRARPELCLARYHRLGDCLLARF